MSKKDREKGGEGDRDGDGGEKWGGEGGMSDRAGKRGEEERKKKDRKETGRR